MLPNVTEQHLHVPNVNVRKNIKAAIGWMVVSYFELNGPLREYFSLYQAVSQREGDSKEKEKTDERKMSEQPHPHLPQAQYALTLLLSK